MNCVFIYRELEVGYLRNGVVVTVRDDRKVNLSISINGTAAKHILKLGRNRSVSTVIYQSESQRTVQNFTFFRLQAFEFPLIVVCS